MGATTAFICDGPGCSVLTKRDKGERLPAEWYHVTVGTVGSIERPNAGNFHARDCALAWLAERV